MMPKKCKVSKRMIAKLVEVNKYLMVVRTTDSVKAWMKRVPLRGKGIDGLRRPYRAREKGEVQCRWEKGYLGIGSMGNGSWDGS